MISNDMSVKALTNLGVDKYVFIAIIIDKQNKINVPNYLMKYSESYSGWTIVENIDSFDYFSSSLKKGTKIISLAEILDSSAPSVVVILPYILCDCNFSSSTIISGELISDGGFSRWEASP
jgi:hypothetical protein